MKMTKYDVRTVEVETKNGKGAYETFSKDTNQDTQLLKDFDNLEQAKEFYNTIQTSVRYMGGYYLHKCKFIEENEYNEDGETVGGGVWWDMEFPTEY